MKLKLKTIPYFFCVVLLAIGLISCHSAQKTDKLASSSEQTNPTNKTKDSISDSKTTNPKVEIKPKSLISIDNPLDPRSYLVHFRNENGVIVKTLDIRKKNPYLGLSYPIDYADQDSLEYRYKLNGLDSKNNLLSGMRINQDAYHEDYQHLRLFISTPIIEIKGQIVAVAYLASYYSNSEDVLGTQGVVLLYDQTGKEIRRISDEKDGFADIRLSDDGQYLMQKYGFNYGEDGGGQLDRGFRFYNTQTGSLIFEKELGKDQFIGSYDFFPKTKYLISYYRREGEYHEKYIIDFINSSIYKKSMDRRRYSNEPTYRNTLFPLFLKSLKISDLLKDGFQKIN